MQLPISCFAAESAIFKTTDFLSAWLLFCISTTKWYTEHTATGLLPQVPKGAWFPLVLAACVMAVSVVWHSSYIKTMRFHSAHARQLSALLVSQAATSDSANPSVYTVRVSPHHPLNACRILLSFIEMEPLKRPTSIRPAEARLGI